MVKKLVDAECETSSGDQKSRIQGELFLGKLEPLYPELKDDRERNMTLGAAMEKVEEENEEKSKGGEKEGLRTTKEEGGPQVHNMFCLGDNVPILVIMCCAVLFFKQAHVCACALRPMKSH